ncbi:MAG: hypothetical protein ACOCXA_09140, partial [Planctomycetota bacterium]
MAIPRAWAADLDIPLHVAKQDAIHPDMAAILQLDRNQQKQMVDLVRDTREAVLVGIFDTATDRSGNEAEGQVIRLPAPGSWLEPLIDSYLAGLGTIAGERGDLLPDVSTRSLLLSRIIPDHIYENREEDWVITIRGRRAGKLSSV